MARHVYTLGQKVQFLPGPYDNNIPRCAYTVTRLMPNDGLDREYRVKAEDGHERVLRESQLRAGPTDRPAGW
jgi:hypothetical protein